METSVDSYFRNWNILRAFTVMWLFLILFSLTISFPKGLLSAGAVCLLFGASSGTFAVLKGRWVWSKISLLDGGVMLLILLITQTASKTVMQDLPITLLLFVMLLFAVEVLALVSKQHEFYSKGLIESDEALSILRRSAQQAFTQTTRLGLFYGSCYLISLAVLFAGTFLVSFSSLLADVSLFVVVVSISLALLILLRED